MKSLLFGLLLGSATSAFGAKGVCTGGAALGDGIRVEYALYADGTDRFDSRELCRHEAGRGYIRRTLKIGQAPMFGYELHIKRNASGEKPFHVSVTRVESVAMAYFPKNPQPVDVGPEDTVEFMLMENRTSSQRLVDRFRISNNSDAQTGPPFHVDLMGEPKPPAGTSLRLAAPRMYRGGEPLKLTSKGTEISGALLWVYVPGKGRFWFSVAEKGRFRNTAVARGNRLEYEWDGAKYAIETAKPIISLPGEWVIWVRLEEGWKPEPGDYLGEPIDPAFLYMGAVGD